MSGAVPGVGYSAVNEIGVNETDNRELMLKLKMKDKEEEIGCVCVCVCVNNIISEKSYLGANI